MERILAALATDRYVTLPAAARVEEWLLRPLRRRAAERALRQADTRTKLLDTGHLARVALLLRAGKDTADLDDEAAVRAAFATLTTPPDARFPVQTLSLLGAMVLLAVMGVAVHFLTRPFAADRSGVGQALSQNLGGLVADVANGARPAPDAAMARVFPGRVLPEQARKPVADLFTAELLAAKDPKEMPGVYRAIREVNRVFGELSQPFYLDARYYQRAPLLYAFYKEREDLGRADGFRPERIVFLWRLDHLNLSKAALGYTHREADSALVLYDQVEEFLIRDVLPALAEGEKVDLVDQQSRDPQKAWQDDIEMRAARMVRESFAGTADHDRLVELGTLLARRRAIVTKWRNELLTQGQLLREPSRLLPEADYTEDLRLRVPSASRHEWDEVHAKRGSSVMLSTFETLRDRFADDVARHELQHRFDAQRSPDCDSISPCAALDIPPAVRERVGPHDDAKVMLGSMPGRVRNETSAYLAQMARPGGMPKMTILGLLRTVLDRDAWGDVYCNTTLVLLDVLAKELGYTDERMPLVAGGAVQRASVASLTVLLFAKSDDDLRRAAQKTWREQFGYELPQATITPSTQAKRWRH